MRATFNYQDGVELVKVHAPLSKTEYFTVFDHHYYLPSAVAEFCIICNHSLMTHIEYQVEPYDRAKALQGL